ncbi:MAG: hydroxyacid dehydrogenase [Deltaproteobacteria bacterium]|nr:hydroxyacid dehydrogenase [Deltaproteobacteria bacterium]
MPKKVLLPQPIESEAVKALENAGCEIITAADPSPETVRPMLAGSHGIVLRTGIKISQELLSHADDLEIVARTGGGLDNVDVPAATKRGVMVTSNLGVNTSSVVEHVLAFMLALSKQLPLMDREMRKGNFAIRYQNLSGDLRGKTLGVIGFGRIGSELGRCCRQTFGMNVLAYDPFLSQEAKETFKEWVRFPDMQELCSSSDVISIHVPLTDHTRNMVGERELSWMKPETVLINTSRGSLIDEDALYSVLKAKRILGAGLDVFSAEPVPADHPLLELDNILVTPHSAALTRECVIRMATEAAQCVIDLFAGRRPKNIANPQVLVLDRWKHLSQ